MKKIFAFLFVSCILFNGCSSGPKRETISISGAFALYPIAVKWGEAFQKLHPEVKFDISAGGAGKGVADALGGLVDLGAVSRDLQAAEISKGAFPIDVAIDAVIPTYNTANPKATAINHNGLTQSQFKSIFLDGKVDEWKVYVRSDAAGAAETWAKYLGGKQEDLQGTGVFGDPGLLQAVQKDINGIGFNNISYVFDPNTKKPLSGIGIIPIDINGNGVIDKEEDFYGNLDDLMGAIAAGQYPKPPARKLFFISKNKPNKKIVIAFLKWVLNDGQKFLKEAGYIALTPEEINTQLKALEN